MINGGPSGLELPEDLSGRKSITDVNIIQNYFPLTGVMYLLLVEVLQVCQQLWQLEELVLMSFSWRSLDALAVSSQLWVWRPLLGIGEKLNLILFH